jgi:hypothetical protein
LKGAIGNANPALMQGIGQGLDIINSALGDRAEYSGKYGSLARGLDTAYDTASDALMSSGNPYGMAAGAAMKLNGALSKGVGKLGGGTDGMCVCAGTKVYTASGRITTIE